MINKSNLCQLYLKSLYQHLSGHELNRKYKATIAETYGEILYESVSELIYQLTLSANDIFFDLGSGLGKVVTQVFLQSEVKEATGIEINPELYQYALLAAHKVQEDLPEFFSGGRQLRFLQGDFLEVSFEKATVILISSPLFTPETLFILGKMINLNTNINKVISLRPLFSLTRLSMKKVIRVEGSWDSALCYLYAN